MQCCLARARLVTGDPNQAREGRRSGWKGRPVVVLGRREGLPMGLHPLVSFVARPVKHVRLATALLKASALMRSKSQVRPICLGLICDVLSWTSQPRHVQLAIALLKAGLPMFSRPCRARCMSAGHV